MLKINQAEGIHGTITVPGDKSISHRAVMLGSISQGKSTIKGFLQGEDCLSTIACFKKMGVEIFQQGNEVTVQGNGVNGLKEPIDILDAGNSGTTMRLMAGILAGQSFLSIVTGDESLRKRPMARIAAPLRQMGAAIDGRQDGRLAPLVIRGGGLRGIDYVLPVSSAQVKSAVLLAGLYAEGTTRVKEPVKSRDHTERMLKAFGGNVAVEGEWIRIGQSQLIGQEVEVPGDISSAAFFMVAAAAKPGAELMIKNVGLNPTRTGIIDVLKAMGAAIAIESIRTSGGEEIGDLHILGGRLRGTSINQEILPRLIDEIPVIAVAAALAEGKTIITGAEELRHKESDRIAAMVTEMKKLGIQVKELPDGMEIEGPNEIGYGIVESYSDHRIAMALAICGLFSKGGITINHPQCIAVSFPEFQEKLKAIVK
ncbi:3-phosphoshikimate 1-carboxyvinyltransferase [Alkaliphilus crotonatoxidans]